MIDVAAVAHLSMVIIGNKTKSLPRSEPDSSSSDTLSKITLQIDRSLFITLQITFTFCRFSKSNETIFVINKFNCLYN